MQDNTNLDDESVENYGDKVRAQMDTKDVGAIMGRFFSAVSWRDE